jgi:hypothetical protein
MFIQNCLPIPTCKNTPKGGRSMAIMMRSRSIVSLFLLLGLYLIRCPTLVVADTESILQRREQGYGLGTITHILGLFPGCMIHNVFHV